MRALPAPGARQPVGHERDAYTTVEEGRFTGGYETQCPALPLEQEFIPAPKGRHMKAGTANRVRFSGRHEFRNGLFSAASAGRIRAGFQPLWSSSSPPSSPAFGPPRISLVSLLACLPTPPLPRSPRTSPVSATSSLPDKWPWSP